MQICKHGVLKSVYAKNPLFQGIYDTKTWSNAYNPYPAYYEIIQYYRLLWISHNNKIFINKFYILLHLLFYYYISARSPSEHSRNILHIVTLALDHRLSKHSKFIRHFTTLVVTTLFPTGNIFYNYNTSDTSPFNTSAIFSELISSLPLGHHLSYH